MPDMITKTLASSYGTIKNLHASRYIKIHIIIEIAFIPFSQSKLIFEKENREKKVQKYGQHESY